jgi:hypothetical protein
MSTGRQTSSKAATKSTAAATAKAKAKKPRAATASRAGASVTRRPSAKPAAARRAASTANNPVKTPAPPTKPQKPPKTKLVRDSFTMPKPEYVVIDALKQRSARAGRPLKKSEVLRAGVKALAAMADAEFAVAIANVQALKTGRPTSKKTAEPESQE